MNKYHSLKNSQKYYMTLEINNNNNLIKQKLK